MAAAHRWLLVIPFECGSLGTRSSHRERYGAGCYYARTYDWCQRHRTRHLERCYHRHGRALRPSAGQTARHHSVLLCGISRLNATCGQCLRRDPDAGRRQDSFGGGRRGLWHTETRQPLWCRVSRRRRQTGRQADERRAECHAGRTAWCSCAAFQR